MHFCPTAGDRGSAGTFVAVAHVLSLIIREFAEPYLCQGPEELRQGDLQSDILSFRRALVSLVRTLKPGSKRLNADIYLTLEIPLELRITMR
jgi:hypothetical protein